MRICTEQVFELESSQVVFVLFYHPHLASEGWEW